MWLPVISDDLGIWRKNVILSGSELKRSPFHLHNPRESRSFIYSARTGARRGIGFYSGIDAEISAEIEQWTSTRLVATKNRLVCGKLMARQILTDLTPTKNLQLCDKKSASVRQP